MVDVMKYTARSLAEIADEFDRRADESTIRIKTRMTSIEAVTRIERAATWRAAAEILRNTEIVGAPDLATEGERE